MLLVTCRHNSSYKITKYFLVHSFFFYNHSSSLAVRLLVSLGLNPIFAKTLNKLNVHCRKIEMMKQNPEIYKRIRFPTGIS